MVADFSGLAAWDKFLTELIDNYMMPTTFFKTIFLFWLFENDFYFDIILSMLCLKHHSMPSLGIICHLGVGFCYSIISFKTTQM